MSKTSKRQSKRKPVCTFCGQHHDSKRSYKECRKRQRAR